MLKLKNINVRCDPLTRSYDCYVDFEYDRPLVNSKFDSINNKSDTLAVYKAIHGVLTFNNMRGYYRWCYVGKYQYHVPYWTRYHKLIEELVMFGKFDELVKLINRILGNF
jgi:hypothetical protein